MNRLFNVDISDIIIIDLGMDEYIRKKIINKCEFDGQPYTNVNSKIYSNIAVGNTGYTAQETARELLYQYTNYNENINIQDVPIYYLDVNNRITVEDKKSGIYGDYIIKSISLWLSNESTMTINSSRALKEFNN